MALILFVLFILLLKYVWFNRGEASHYVLITKHWILRTLARRFKWAEDHLHYKIRRYGREAHIHRLRVFKQVLNNKQGK